MLKLDFLWLFRICVVPTPVTPWVWQMLEQCVTQKGAAQSSRTMGCKRHLLWHMSLVGSKKRLKIDLIMKDVVIMVLKEIFPHL